MKKLFAALIFLVIGVIFIPVVQSSIDTYDQIGTNESFTAVSNTTVAEDFVVTQTPLTVDEVYVNGVLLVLTTDYTVAGSTISLLAAESDIGDTILVEYTYEADVPNGVDGLVQVMLIGFVILILVGGVAYIKFK